MSHTRKEIPPKTRAPKLSDAEQGTAYMAQLEHADGKPNWSLQGR
jgi:hypothetical protein